MERLPAPEIPDWLSEQLPFDRYAIEIEDGLRMHLMEQGEGQPVILFHGNPTWGYLYRKVAAELVGDPVRLIMPDMIGLGFSDRPLVSSDHTLANHSRWMSTFVGKLGLSDAVAVIQDWGGPIGLLAMMNNPGLMSGLVVMNTPIGAPKPGFKPTMFHRVFSGPLGGFLSGTLGLPQNRLKFAQGDRSSISGIVQRSYSYPLQKPQGGSATVVELVKMVPDTMEHLSIPLLVEAGEYVMNYEGPKAIVWGDSDPVLGKLRRRVERQLPDAEVTATKAGHFLQEEVPAEIAAAIRDVIARS